MVNATVVIGAVVTVVLLFIVLTYNSLVSLRNQVRNSFSQIDVQLKRRNDLIPNLVETVKGYMRHERGVLENITKARSAVLSATTMQEKAKASNMLTETLKSLFAVSENYPKLRANENFLQLQEEISGTESKIAYARQHYNDVVMALNNKIESFPSDMLAGIFGFRQEELFKAAESERKNVKVEF
ncbi:MAG: LemA family protein [Nanoarchaeota archaeon]